MTVTGALRPAFVGAAIAIAVLARADHAGACSCGRPRIALSPEGNDAPVNSTVVVWVPANEGNLSTLTFSLRHKQGGKVVPVDYRSMGAADIGVVEMIPRARLDADTTYEVAVVRGTDPPSAVGEFTTGRRTLTKAPVARKLLKAGYFKAVPVCCMCQTGDPYAEIEFEEASSREPKTSRVAVWIAGADGKIDYTKPPVTIETIESNLWLGHPSSCSPADFVFPRRKALRLGFKFVDLAGHASPAQDIVLDTTRPKRPDR